jgi:hypothetical protein
MSRVLYIMIWLAISLLGGIVGSYLFNLDFWVASLIAGLTLIVNGFIA